MTTIKNTVNNFVKLLKERKLLRYILLTLFVFTLYCGIFILTKTYKDIETKTEVSKPEDKVTLETISCLEDSIIGATERSQPVCVDSNSIYLLNGKKQVKLLTIEPQKLPYLFISFDRDHIGLLSEYELTLFTITDDTAQKNTAIEFQAKLINHELVKNPDSFDLYISTELVANTPTDYGSELKRLHFNSKAEIQKTDSIKKFIDILRIRSVSKVKDQLAFGLTEAYPFLPPAQLIVDSHGQTIAFDKCDSSFLGIAMINTIAITTNADCKDLKKGSYLVSEENAPKQIDLKPEDKLIILSDSTTNILSSDCQNRNINCILIPDSLPKNATEMQIINKGSIIGFEKVYYFVDYEYTDQTLIRLLILKP